MVQQKTILDVKKELTNRVEELSPIVNGLENYEPYRQLLKLWDNTNKIADNSWHMTFDPQKLNELRITKYAALALINTIPNMKDELNRIQEELVKLNNPDLMVNKDYDPD